MINTMPNLAEIHGAFQRVQPVVPAGVYVVEGRAWKRVLTTGGSATDNSTGVSEVEYRRR